MERKIKVCVALTPTTHKRLKVIASEYGVSVSTLIELLINKKIKL